MRQLFRNTSGGRINRERPLTFSFNGRTLQGFDGDTLASALLANGVRTVNRSFKYHRPRGILAAGVEECNALLTVDSGNGRVPLVRATMIRLCEGLSAASPSGFPHVRFDCGRVFDATRRLWPAGFYNKMFKWPNWHVFEGAVRRMAGLGRVPEGQDAMRYRHMNAHCDVLVVGAGYSGLKRALEEARSGQDVIVAEQDFEPGGSLLLEKQDSGKAAADGWLHAVLDELRTYPNVRLLLEATVSGYYDHNVLTVHDRSAMSNGIETFCKIRAGRVVLATGAIEQPLLFGNNDLPGVMLAGAMRHYAVRFGVRCADNTVGVVNNDLAWGSLLDLHDSGVDVVAIVDSRGEISNRQAAAADQRGIPVHTGSVAVRARGSGAVTGLEILDSRGKRFGIQCRSVAMSGGMNPTVHLYSQAGGKLRYDEALACFVPAHCTQAVEVIGAAAGAFAAPDDYRIAPRTSAPFRSNTQWVDFLHDVLVSDIELAVRENYVSVEHMKRYTTAGMAVDQGKTSNLNALSVLARLTGQDPGNVGTTTFRPNFMPVTMGAIAGNRQGGFYRPTRHLPAHQWHVSQGAAFDSFGLWKRPAYYGVDMQQSIRAEVTAVRHKAGLFDGSPLGKIEVSGPDAAEFLSRVYVNTVATLKPGKVRYGLMLNENGAIIDDGVFVRLADDHFLLNTTSASAERIAAWLEQWHQCEWPELELIMTPVAEQWAVATIAGPKARDVLSTLAGVGDLGTDILPHMSFRQGRLASGLPFRLQRVSFTGELSYELSIPAGQAASCFAQLLAEGKHWGLQPFGIEALDVLRTEKGFLHVGGDTDGTTNPYDVGFGRIVDNKQGDFIGLRSLLRENHQKASRRQLVGIETLDPEAPLEQGAHVICGTNGQRRSEGFVTSACYSPTVERHIGMALIENGFARQGEEVRIYNMGHIVRARIKPPCVYDPKGEKMHA